MKINDEIFGEITIGDLSKVLRYNRPIFKQHELPKDVNDIIKEKGDCSFSWGIVIDKESYQDDPFYYKEEDREILMKIIEYWKGKGVIVPPPRYFVKIVHVISWSSGYWYPDSCVLDLIPNKQTRKINKDFYEKQRRSNEMENPEDLMTF